VPRNKSRNGASSDSSPRWSPDGKYIAFRNRTGAAVRGLWAVDIKTRKSQSIAPWPHRDFYISKPSEMMAWSPDSKEIAFAAAEPEDSPQIVDPRVITRAQI